MTVLVRRFLADYARTPTNLLLLAVVPVVFVILAAGTLSDAARLLGGAGGGSAIATVTAGWAAGLLAAVAMYFQVSSARDTDRRLVLAGLGRGQTGRRPAGHRGLPGHPGHRRRPDRTASADIHRATGARGGSEP